MTHTSSIKDGSAMGLYHGYPDPTISLGDCMQRYFSINGADYSPQNNFYTASPGSDFNYSNMATALNGYITEIASAKPFDDYCDTNIFEPLCMENTAWHFGDFDSAQVARPHYFQSNNYIPYPHHGFADYPDGQLRSNVMDLGNFMIAMLNGGNFAENTILSVNSVNAMLSSQIPSIDATQGLNWYQQQFNYSGGSSLLWGHSGGESGTSTDLFIDTDNKIGICVLTNGEGNPINISQQLYEFALNLNSTASLTPACLGTNSLQELNSTEKKVVKIVDALGRETEFQKGVPLIKVFSDGSTEKVFLIEG